jgi:hypothetical protein
MAYNLEWKEYYSHLHLLMWIVHSNYYSISAWASNALGICKFNLFKFKRKVL